MISGCINHMKKFIQHDLMWLLARIYVFFLLKKPWVQKKIKAMPIALGLVSIGLLLAITLFGIGNFFVLEQESPQEKGNSYEWVQKGQLIAHGMGAANNLLTTNSLDAFIVNYRAGYRVFEVDLLSTSDDVLVLRHDNGRYVPSGDGTLVKRDDPMTYKEFRTFKPNGTMTTLSFEDLAKIMVRFPDIRIVTDTKIEDPKITQGQYEQIVATINKVDPSLMRRVTPQVYNEEMYKQLKSSFAFDSYIYTLYLGSGETEGVIDFMKKNDLKIVTLPEWGIPKEFIQALNEEGLYSFVHTVVTAEQQKQLEQMGVDGYYTDRYTLEEY